MEAGIVQEARHDGGVVGKQHRACARELHLGIAAIGGGGERDRDGHEPCRRREGGRVQEAPRRVQQEHTHVVLPMAERDRAEHEAVGGAYRRDDRG